MAPIYKEVFYTVLLLLCSGSIHENFVDSQTTRAGSTVEAASITGHESTTKPSTTSVSLSTAGPGSTTGTVSTTRTGSTTGTVSTSRAVTTTGKGSTPGLISTVGSTAWMVSTTGSGTTTGVSSTPGQSSTVGLGSTRIISTTGSDTTAGAGSTIGSSTIAGPDTTVRPTSTGIGPSSTSGTSSSKTPGSTKGLFSTLNPSDISQLPTDGVTLFCGDYIEVRIPVRHLVDGVAADDFRFENQNDPQCLGTLDGDDVVLNTSLTDCGTERKESGDYEIYSNRVEDYVDKVISRQYKVDIPITCNISRSGTIDTGAWYQLTDYVLDKDLRNTGEYTFELTFYDDEEYSLPVEGYPYLVALNQELYFEASFGSSNDLDLSIQACRATTTREYDADPSNYYDFIVDWEVVEEEKETTEIICASSEKVRVKTRAFRFTSSGASQTNVYLHCDMYVCDPDEPGSRCADQCLTTPPPGTSRRRRDVSHAVSELPNRRLTRGPIRFQRALPVDEISGDLERQTKTNVYGVIVVAMGTVVIVLLVALGLTLRKLSVTRKENLLDTEASVTLLEK